MKEPWLKVNAVIINGFIISDTIPEGTELLCGNCGESMGRLIRPLEFPFNPRRLADTMYKPKLRLFSYGIQHKTCESVIIRQQERGIVFHTKKTYEELKLPVLN